MASAQTPLVIPPDIGKLTGPLLIGQFFNWGLFGVLCLQAFIYSEAFSSDRSFQKTLVIVVFALETLQTTLGTHDAFRILAVHFGNMEELDKVGLLWFTYPFLNTIMSFIVQLFYAWRIHMLSYNLWIPALIAILAIVQTVAGVWESVVAHQLGTFSRLADESIWTGIVHLTGTALCDILITLSMIFYLKKSQLGFRAFNEFLSKLVNVTAETGILCTIMAILDLALFLGYRRTNYHTVPAAAISKLYANSLFAILNARASFESVDREVHRRSQTSMYLSFADASQFQSHSQATSPLSPYTERTEGETFRSRSRLSRIRDSDTFAPERGYESLDLGSGASQSHSASHSHGGSHNHGYTHGQGWRPTSITFSDDHAPMT